MSTARLWAGGAGLLALLGLCLSGVPADAAEHRVELGIQGGLHAPDEHLTGEEDFLDEIVPTGGLRLAFLLSDHFGLAADGLYSKTETMFPEGDATMHAARGALEWYFTPQNEDRAAFFLSAGGGWMKVTMDKEVVENEDFSRPFASLGFGQRVPLGDKALFRWELRGDATFWERQDIVWEDMIQSELLLGLSMGFGGSSDTDGDGVSDNKDDCPATPAGAVVNMRGCPTDSDGDGVWDGLDTCADTPKGAKVDMSGCPSDTDGDGVLDGIDRCPASPRGTSVDARGCPKDADGDGVFDGLDKCASTPKGAKVDATGCPMDSDGDGVYDGIDRCPDSPAGAKVDARGCPVLFEKERGDLTLEGVNFESGSDVLTSGAKTVLDRVAGSLKAWPEVRVEVGGHTDSRGRDAFNLELSQKRALSVKRYLESKGVGADQLEARGYGETQPIADNESEAGRAKNRRVVLKRL